jgi:glycosyltransferase involved in cell wall biosynthesis
MRVLYITLFHSGDINGGYTFCSATINAFQDIIGRKNLDIVTSELDNTDWQSRVVYKMPHYDTGVQKIINLVTGNITQISDKDINIVLQLIEKNRYNLVVFGNSETGKLIRKVKEKTNVKTMTWYHDIIADVICRKIHEQFNPVKYLMWLAERNAEKQDVKFTDIHCVLHGRDAGLMKKYWGIDPEIIIPIGIQDNYKTDAIVMAVDVKEPLKLLFVGSYGWKVNVEAAEWFCLEVMSKLTKYDIEFQIAGFGMERIAEESFIQNSTNVKILGTVEDLSKIYANADVVVEPILHGSGMKVKTAEALMFGKEIIGTTEALVGYDELQVKVCNTHDEFIERIIKYYKNRPEKFIPANRKAYQDNYSVEAINNKLRSVMENLGLD